MHDAGQRAGGPMADVGRGARDGAGGREAAEQGRDDVRNALPDQFLVRVMPGAGHAIGDDGRQERLDCTEHRDREGGADQRDRLSERDLGPCKLRQAGRYAAERGSDGGHARQVQQRLQQRHHEHRNQRARHPGQARYAWREQHQQQSDRR